MRHSQKHSLFPICIRAALARLGSTVQVTCAQFLSIYAILFQLNVLETSSTSALA